MRKFCCPCFQNTSKNVTTYYLHCHYSFQATIHFLSGLLQWPSNGFPCLHTYPTAVFFHLNREAKVIQLTCEFFIPLLETFQWPLILLSIAMYIWSYLSGSVIYLLLYFHPTSHLFCSSHSKFLVIFKHARHIPTSGSWRLLILLPGVLYPQITPPP